MTLEQLQIAVCGKLPELIAVDALGQHWLETNAEVNWPSEGLRVCHEAEKLLRREDRHSEFVNELLKELSRNRAISATYPQRLAAIHRVWFPENPVYHTQTNQAYET